MMWNKLQTKEEIIQWAETQPFCLQMQQCQQDSEWHSEGDVWTHTKMVMDQVSSQVLLFTALLHDSAKPLTTKLNPETNRIESPKHAVKGESLARNILRSIDCPLITREEICHMVRYHGRPVFLMEKDVPEREVITLSHLLNNELLYQFAVADNRGRDTDSLNRPEENLEFWKILAEEHNCYSKPYLFANKLQQYKAFNLDFREAMSHVPYEDYKLSVTMMSGLPGAGKDTWIKNYCDCPVVSLDSIREDADISPTENQGVVAQIGKEECRTYLRSRTNFVFNATNLLKQTRMKWIQLFVDYGAKVEIVYLEPSLSTILKQNKQREKSVPENVIHALTLKCEPPTIAECHELRIIGET